MNKTFEEYKAPIAGTLLLLIGGIVGAVITSTFYSAQLETYPNPPISYALLQRMQGIIEACDGDLNNGIDLADSKNCHSFLEHVNPFRETLNAAHVYCDEAYIGNPEGLNVANIYFCYHAARMSDRVNYEWGKLIRLQGAEAVSKVQLDGFH